MKIEDNYIDQEKFDELQNLMLGSDFSWYYNSYIDYKTEKEKEFQFTHTFYKKHVSTSSFLEKLNPIVDIIKPIVIWRIKANLLTRTPNIVENAFHVDMHMSEEKIKQWTTSIFYINTNNGHTKFEDGSIVESVANRMVTFPANLKHRGTSCTDEKIRVVINFNYFK